jgi:hypothetical protein
VQSETFPLRGTSSEREPRRDNRPRVREGCGGVESPRLFEGLLGDASVPMRSLHLAGGRGEAPDFTRHTDKARREPFTSDVPSIPRVSLRPTGDLTLRVLWLKNPIGKVFTIGSFTRDWILALPYSNLPE